MPPLCLHFCRWAYSMLAQSQTERTLRPAGGVRAQRVAIKAPSAAPLVVFLFALGEGQVGERLDLPVESEAVADRALCAGEGIGEDSRPGQGRSAAERSPSRRSVTPAPRDDQYCARAARSGSALAAWAAKIKP